MAVAITGTASGMGAEALRHFRDAGATVHAIDIKPGESEPDSKPSGSDSDGAQPTYHRCDLGRQASIDETVASPPPTITRASAPRRVKRGHQIPSTRSGQIDDAAIDDDHPISELMLIDCTPRPAAIDTSAPTHTARRN